MTKWSKHIWKQGSIALNFSKSFYMTRLRSASPLKEWMKAMSHPEYKVDLVTIPAAARGFFEATAGFLFKNPAAAQDTPSFWGFVCVSLFFGGTGLVLGTSVAFEVRVSLFSAGDPFLRLGDFLGVSGLFEVYWFFTDFKCTIFRSQFYVERFQERIAIFV